LLDIYPSWRTPTSNLKHSARSEDPVTTNSTMADFPFDHVILTFPDQLAADAANSGPLERIRATYRNCSVVATTDPYDARVGSGGGTLAALPVDKGSVLIVHAGGQSSRCPTQMVLGKAWTSLPCCSEAKTPIDVWLQQCRHLFRGIPVGSVVVLASDTLLQFPIAASVFGAPRSLETLWNWHVRPSRKRCHQATI
jgi:hypothetical protein